MKTTARTEATGRLSESLDQTVKFVFDKNSGGGKRLPHINPNYNNKKPHYPYPFKRIFK
jgi:hypothetical protein